MKVDLKTKKAKVIHEKEIKKQGGIKVWSKQK